MSSRNQNAAVYVINFESEESPPMRKVWNILFFAFFITCMFLLKPRQDVVFAALNESQCIRLFENGRDFQFFDEENITYTGTYKILNDTLILTYKEQVDLSSNQRNSELPDKIKNLPSRFHINKSKSEVKSLDSRFFTAEIFLDIRAKSFKTAPSKVRMLDIHQEEITAIGARP